jgi:hypothetical protein
LRPVALGAAATLAAALAAGPAAPAFAAPLEGALLPIPAAPPPGQQFTVSAVDVNPIGVVAGNATVTVTNPDGTQSSTSTPQRWGLLPNAGWRRQQLGLPAGATSGAVAGLTNVAEGGGSVTVDGAQRAARWSIDGRTATLIGTAGSRVTAVGPNGPWGVSTDDASNPIAGSAELVARDGVRTPLQGTPELNAGYRRSVRSIAGPQTALVSVSGGVGWGSTVRPVIWRDGATLALPVFSTPMLPNPCVSSVLADGSVVHSGFHTDTSPPHHELVRHVGGVPGTDVELADSTNGDPITHVACGSDGLAADGGIAGHRFAADVPHAAYWSPDNVRTDVPLADGERSAQGVAVANGGRMVIRAEGTDGSVRLALWRAGVRSELSTPAGWSLVQVVELTDRGLLVANVRNAAGVVRPVAWDLRSTTAWSAT